MVVREIGKCKAKAYDSIEDKSAPWSPAPANRCIVVRPHLDIHEIGAERYDKCGYDGERVPSILDWNNFRESIMHFVSPNSW